MNMQVGSFGSNAREKYERLDQGCSGNEEQISRYALELELKEFVDVLDVWEF